MLIFKICHRLDWETAERRGVYDGSPKDRADGFLHFSGMQQVQNTLQRYYAEADDLVLVAVKTGDLGKALKFEPSRDGALFPHLYSKLPVSVVKWVRPITRRDGGFVLPVELAAQRD
ncbi:MAG: DUF952 domain-containing protein [Proteobacteria bacterium]|nr:DUF952 domain-containing protein [Pseudomonadota bacterium]